MFSMIIKFSIAFIASYVILSFQISHKPIFYHLSSLTGPLGGEIQSSLTKSAKRTYDKSKIIGESFFSNSEPKINDKINSSRSSKKIQKKNDELILEEIRREEIQKLDELIQQN